MLVTGTLFARDGVPVELFVVVGGGGGVLVGWLVGMYTMEVQ